jgi:hypothetical protein
MLLGANTCVFAIETTVKPPKIRLLACYFCELWNGGYKVLRKIGMIGITDIDRLSIDLFFHFHQFIVKILRKIGSIGIADIDQPIDQVTD